MNNNYEPFLKTFFKKLLYYRHVSERLNKVLKEDILKHTSDGAQFHSWSSLVISDWTEPKENGYEVVFPTGVTYETSKNNYEEELNKIFSTQLCLLYAQSFESFERLLKDCLWDKGARETKFHNIIKEKANLPNSKTLTRRTMPGGDIIFKILRKACGESYKNYSKINHKDFTFDELLDILAKTRHAITHNESQLDLSELNSKRHRAIFKRLFLYEDIHDGSILVKLNYMMFSKLVKRFSEFAFQIFKMLSEEEGLKITNNFSEPPANN